METRWLCTECAPNITVQEFLSRPKPVDHDRNTCELCQRPIITTPEA